MKKSHIVLVFLMLSFLLAGGADAYFLAVKGISEASYIVHGLAVALCCFAWCYYHSRENGHSNRDNLAFWCFFFAPLGIPFYSFRVYGFRRGAILVLSSIVFFISAMSLFFVAEMVVAKLHS